MEIHIIQVGQKGLALLRKCVPEQQKEINTSVYLLFSEKQKCVPEQQISTDERYVFLRRPWYKNDSLIHVLCTYG